jgi:redox-sensitive bicupin YhaK (pirin superfamily)
MTAGTGILHSEFNHSATEGVRFLQIWILPEARGLEPGYEQKHFAAEEKTNRLRLVVSRDGSDGSLRIHQDADVYASILEPGALVKHALSADRHAWIQVVRGSVTLNGQTLSAGDGAQVSGEQTLHLEGVDQAELLVFDLA